MITTNADKKALVEKLLRENKITLDDMLMLLETDKEYISMPAPYPVYPQPYYNWPWNIPYCQPYPSTGVLTVGDFGTLTIGDYQTYPPGTGISYTSSVN